jgi:hypothetical protein
MLAASRIGEARRAFMQFRIGSLYHKTYGRSMLSTLISILLAIIVLGVLYWAIMKLAGVFGIPAPIVTVIQVLLVVVVVIWIVDQSGLLTGGFNGHLLR